MAASKLDLLIPKAKTKALQVQAICRKEYGFELLIYCTLRSLEEQARLFRQSKTREEVNAKIKDFKKRGFGFLANIITKVGPCTGPTVTNAAPGESWHNYGEAWDAVPLIAGKPAWNYSGGAKKLWDAYGAAVRKVKMYWAGDWKTFKEYPHAQMRSTGNALSGRTSEEVQAALKKVKLL